MAAFVMAVVQILFVNIWSNVAVEYDVRQNLAREVRRNLKYVEIRDGELYFAEGYEQKQDGIYFLLLNDEMEAVAGSYPDKFVPDEGAMLNHTRIVKCRGETFYVHDMQRTKTLGTDYIMRGVVRRADIFSRYQTLEYFSYLSIVAVFGIVTVCGLVLGRRISGSLKGMCRTAETIGRDFSISERMEHNSRFYELAVLTDAENRMLDRIEHAVKEQEQFTSDAAHELRTPVAVISAQCQSVAGREQSREELLEALEVVERQAGRINAMIAQLLHLSRLDQEQTKIRREEIDLVEIVQSVCEDEQEKAGESVAIEMRLNKAETSGDISLIMIAFRNLLTNAIKFGAGCGGLEVETGTKDGEVYVSVRDHGCGIKEEELERIFQRFYKEDKSRNSQGIGLGLPLAQKIALRHGGRITAVSRAGEGSTFTLFLPGM